MLNKSNILIVLFLLIVIGWGVYINYSDYENKQSYKEEFKKMANELDSYAYATSTIQSCPDTPGMLLDQNYWGDIKCINPTEQRKEYCRTHDLSQMPYEEWDMCKDLTQDK